MPLYVFEGKRPSISSEAFVHPDAVLIGEVTVEARCYVGAGAVLRGDIGAIRIGRGSNVQENCVIHAFPNESTILHPNSHIGHGSILHGCEIHSNVYVGMGSIIGDRVRINSNTLVGAGSFVPFDKEIPPNSLVVGSPAKVVKRVSPEQSGQIANSLALYQDLARRHLKAMREITVEEVIKVEGD